MAFCKWTRILAARELRDALQVNPYDIDQTAEAIRAALEMSAEEKHAVLASLPARGSQA